MPLEEFAREVMRKYDNRRFISTDIRRSEELAIIADWYIRTYEGPSAYVRDLQRHLLSGRRLTAVQLAGALNWYQKQQRGVRS